MATLEVVFDSVLSPGSAEAAAGRTSWQAIDREVEARTEAAISRPRRLRERLMFWLIEYNKY